MSCSWASGPESPCRSNIVFGWTFDFRLITFCLWLIAVCVCVLYLDIDEPILRVRIGTTWGWARWHCWIWTRKNRCKQRRCTAWGRDCWNPRVCSADSPESTWCSASWIGKGRIARIVCISICAYWESHNQRGGGRDWTPRPSWCSLLLLLLLPFRCCPLSLLSHASIRTTTS